MESEGKDGGSRNRKRKKGSKETGSSPRIDVQKTVVPSAVKPGRQRKPRRGNRAGAGRRRNHKTIPAAIGEVDDEKKKVKRQRKDDSVEKVNGDGQDKTAGRWNPEKKEGNLSEDASLDNRVHESLASVETKESKRKKANSRSKFKGALLQAESTVDEGDQGTEPPKPGSKSLSFLEKMRARLSGGRFRMLNESLYTCKGDEAFELFKEDPGAFDLYHTGYQEQMSRWPVLPVTVVSKWLKSRNPNLIVADFGCGDARLARSVKNKVFSLDLVASDPSVMACNMAKTPLETSSIDVAVFCLSLMGTDYPTFLDEAHRVLRSRGWLLIAEVKSRLDAGRGGAGSQAFISAIRSLGFVLDSQDDSNKMFHMFFFQKEGSKHESKRKIIWPELKPCIYKRR